MGPFKRILLRAVFMNTSAIPGLEDSARRNPKIKPERVRQMQEIVQRLQNCGLLKPPKYGIQPPFASDQRGTAAAQGVRTMNRIGE
jgi:hypothetical protein